MLCNTAQLQTAHFNPQQKTGKLGQWEQSLCHVVFQCASVSTEETIWKHRQIKQDEKLQLAHHSLRLADVGIADLNQTVVLKVISCLLLLCTSSILLINY